MVNIPLETIIARSSSVLIGYLFSRAFGVGIHYSIENEIIACFIRSELIVGVLETFALYQRQLNVGQYRWQTNRGRYRCVLTLASGKPYGRNAEMWFGVASFLGRGVMIIIMVKNDPPWRPL